MKTYKDIVGDGGSRIVEQVGERQAAIERSLSSVRHLVAVASGKGGVGKSTLSALLARALCHSGRAVAVLDADVNGPSQTRLAGMAQAPLVPDAAGRLPLPRSGAGVGVVSLGTVVPESEAVSFDTTGSGDSHFWRASREFTFLAELLGSVRWGELDFLIVDLPPGAERTFQHAEFLGPRASFLLVTIPSELSRGVVSRSLSALRRTPNRVLGYVENMTGYYCADCDDVKPLFPGAGGVSLDLPLLGAVPFDPELAAACDRGIGALAAPIAGAVDELVEKVAEALEAPR